jgi:hypothetical protein
MRFELSEEMVAALKAGSALDIGVEHAIYSYNVTADDETRQSLINDLD